MIRTSSRGAGSTGGVGASGAVGLWHETYRVATSDIETIHTNVPAFGLAAASASVPIVRGRDSAAARIGVSDVDEPVLPTY
jgi:hypothetical protein